MKAVAGSSFGARGTLSSFRPASCGRRLPLRAFTSLLDHTRFSHLSPPPRERGTTLGRHRHHRSQKQPASTADSQAAGDLSEQEYAPVAGQVSTVEIGDNFAGTQIVEENWLSEIQFGTIELWHVVVLIKSGLSSEATATRCRCEE